MTSKVTSIAVPTGSEINSRLADASYYDCYAITVPNDGRSALGYFLTAISNTPAWVNSLMTLRNKTVLLFGLKDLGGMGNFDAAKKDSDYLPGDRVGIFTLISNTPNEVLLGDSDRHLDVVLSVYKNPVGRTGDCSVSVTTVVHTHNLLGKAYMLPVTPLHKLIAPAVLAQVIS
jgi:hypothetical protein